ncbi:ABC transporter permease [Streptomyces sp. NBC_01014]|uniref:ABC transporter permease n=1 Tax=Streptomyces sp. NBC_01014 TaxID=2903719 RepID=UPI00386DF541|nr:ABC transporter permease [Streptomyces sp. NBC_01014]
MTEPTPTPAPESTPAPATPMTVAVEVPDLEPRARFADLLAAEWIKLWSLRSTIWAFTATMLAVLGVTASAAYADYQNWPGYGAQHQQYFRMFGAAGDSFPMGSATLLVLGAGAIGAITVLGEYTTGLIRTTFTAVPARRSVMVAKVGVVAATTGVFGVLVALFSFGVAQLILSGRGADAGLGHHGVLRLLAASAALSPVSALVGMGMAAVIRHSVLTIVATVVLLFVLPSLLSSRKHLTVTILHTTVLQAWRRLSFDPSPTDPWQWTTTGAWTVLAGWALAATVLAVLTPNHRDQ